ncbi:hypothetical protein D0962_09270 [Leptolyngbyaceae cyanobacterium CCMR0082]|uniref:Uncharacterized protein n=2 Tax=Adonisia turfae TaxID=2950184 RepID=A0A6M0S3S5_9CYAN|nr:hypothetical protein [Adonisia turfae CCMR0081]NEZ62970.1 hypothetical protein [Adonisia turfae CCMR0082]
MVIEIRSSQMGNPNTPKHVLKTDRYVIYAAVHHSGRKLNAIAQAFTPEHITTGQKHFHRQQAGADT